MQSSKGATLSARLVKALWGSQFARWFWVGVANTLFTLAIYQVALLIMPYRIAYTLAFVAGIATGAWAQAHIAFGTRLRRATFARFTAFYLANYFAGLALLTLLVERAGMHEAIAPFAVLAVQGPLSFLGSRLALRHGAGPEQPR